MRTYPYNIEAIKVCASYIKELIKTKLITNALMEAIGEVANPLKGWCYVACALLYQKFNGEGMNLYKMKDDNDIFHWWIVLDASGEVIDITREQYEIEGLLPPYENKTSSNIIEKASLMGFNSYKKKVAALEEELQTYELQGLTLDEKLRKIL